LSASLPDAGVLAGEIGAARWYGGKGAAISMKAALREARVAEHYFDNVILLLAFILDDLQEYREGKKRAWPELLRLQLDLDKMLSDTRAMLDALYCLTLLYQPDAGRIPKSKRRSFGKLSDWYEAKSPEPFAAPLVGDARYETGRVPENVIKCIFNF